MVNGFFKTTLAVAALFILLACSYPNKALQNQNSFNIYKEDFLQAVDLIANDYIYLERKLGITREQFVTRFKHQADSTDWSKGKETFTAQIRELCASLADGHVDWAVDIDDQQPKAWYLGFIATQKKDNKIYIAKVHSHYQRELQVGDQILKWNGADISHTVDELISLYPQSTNYASSELAIRHLSTEYSFRPLRKELHPVQIEILDAQGDVKTVTLQWQRIDAGLENPLAHSNAKVLLTRSLVPSLEDIPPIHKESSPSLIYYFIRLNDKKFAVLHPRDFYHWNMVELDMAMAAIVQEKPSALIVDLKDSAGGSFMQVMYLSHALNVQDNFDFFYDNIDSKTHLRTTGVDDFKFIADEINLQNVWNGEVLFRINSLTKSGGDFFIRKMQLAKRGIIFGQPSAGAGGGTDSFILDNTQTELSFPLRERILKEDNGSIEGHSTMPDVIYDGDIIGYLQQHH